MTRRGVSRATPEAAALQASRRMIARCERPAYRLRTGQDGRWTTRRLRGCQSGASDSREALQAAIGAIAARVGTVLGPRHQRQSAFVRLTRAGEARWCVLVVSTCLEERPSGGTVRPRTQRATPPLRIGT